MVKRSSRSRGVLPATLDYAAVRRISIVSLFSDDVLLEQLVLKGGNAMALIYGFGHRASLDIDLSIDGDFDDLNDVRARIFKALREQFQRAGYVLFDEKFEPKPSLPNVDPRWGGYVIQFKLIDKAAYDTFGGDPEQIRRNALVTGPGQQRTFRIELSKHEFCDTKTEKELDHYTIYVYTPEMIAIEKLRALCQQLPEYGSRLHKTARARDFYDIYVLAKEARVRVGDSQNADLIRAIFSAKDVPLDFIERIAETREFHRPDWPSVRDSVAGELKEFDYYFDFVVSETTSLKALWKKQLP